MARFILHLGDGKCGSTSIQRSLFEATDHLADHGIVYKTTMPRNGHAWLTTLIGRSTRADDTILRQRSIETIKQIKANVRPSDAILLSGEVFLSIPPGDAMRIIELFELPIDSLDLIAYVRSPSKMYLSLNQQKLKGTEKITHPLNYYRPVHEWLEAWSFLPITRTLETRLFEISELVDQDPVADFQNILRRLVLDDSIDLPRIRSNSSPSAEQIIFIQEFRARHFPNQAGKLLEETQELAKFLERLNGIGLPTTKAELKDDVAEYIQMNHSVVIKRLNTHYLASAIPEPSKYVHLTDLPGGQHLQIADILESWSRPIIDALALLNPYDNPALRMGLEDTVLAAAQTLSGGDDANYRDVLREIARYLRVENCKRAAGELVDRASR